MELVHGMLWRICISMTKEKLTQGILILLGILLSVFGYIIGTILDNNWGTAPFLFTVLATSIAIFLVSSNPIYSYLYNTSRKNRNLTILALSLLLAVISITLYIIFYLAYYPSSH